MMNYEKWIPLAVIGGIVIFAIRKLSNTPQSIVRGYNYSSQVTPANSNINTAGFSGVVDVAKAQIAANTARDKAASDIELQKARNDGAVALANGQSGMIARYLGQAQNNAANQSDALARYYQAQTSAANRNLIANAINSALRLLGNQQQGGRPSPMGGTPPFNPNASSPILRQPPILQRNTDRFNPLASYYQGYLWNQQNSPLEYSDVSSDVFGGLDFGSFLDFNYGDYGNPGFGYDYTDGAGELTNIYE